MYEPTTALSLHRLSRQSLHKRYESDEEDVSESDAGGHDFVPSPTGSQRAGAFDSDISADENSHVDPDSDREDELLAPYREAKRQRPVSMDTVKRSSDVSFVEDAYVFDPEEDIVLELPSLDSPAPLASSLFLQPAIYVSPNTPPTTNIRSRSSSPSSIFSVENAEIQIAKKITLMEPSTRPTLVFINSLGSRSKNARSRPSRSRTRGNPRDRESRIFDGRFENGLEIPRLAGMKTSASKDTEHPESSSDESTSTTPAMPPTDNDTPRPLQSANINCVSEIPVVPFSPPSPHIRPQSLYRRRPHTSGAEKSIPAIPNARPRRPTEPGPGRPASIRSNSNSSVPSYASRPTSPFSSDLGYIPDHYSEAGSLLSRTSSPVSFASSPPSSYQPQSQPPKRGHTPSKHSVSNILAQRSPMMRRMTREHSATSSIASTSSMSNSSTVHISASGTQTPLTAVNYDSHVVRKPSQRRHARHNSAAPGGRKFMGLKLGKKSFMKA